MSPLPHPLPRLILLTASTTRASLKGLPTPSWPCSSCARLLRSSPQTRNAHQTPTRPSPSAYAPTPRPRSSFHTSSRRYSDDAPNHYEALQLQPSATAAEIKRQFYALSKSHHPDRNPNDPTATTRFVAISEAYHTLSVPQKRAQYDAQLSQKQQPGSKGRWGSVWRGSAGEGGQQYPHGSHSSASFAGSRTASGLNKKRSTFRGPPPSFYKSGGYGTHGAKRAEYAHHQHEGTGEKREKDAGQESYGGMGFGPGQTGQGNEVPHFDDKRHKQTHDQVNEYIYARRRRPRVDEAHEDIDRGGQLANFLLVSGVIGIIGWSAKVLGDSHDEPKNKT